MKTVPHYHLACDLGAESGRVVLGKLEEGKLTLEEIHRFPSAVIAEGSSLCWDVEAIFAHLKKGVEMAQARQPDIASVSVDSWGVDYVLMKNGKMLAQPHHYRDVRTDSIYLSVRKELGDDVIYEETGIQMLPFNTLYQLRADSEKQPEVLSQADCFLTIADYFNYRFSGILAIEESLASTTQLYQPVLRNWSSKLISLANLPQKIFPKIVPSATVLGPLFPEASRSNCKVVATCSHDTAAAVAAVPAEDGTDWAYLSSGTWSLLGVELTAPNLSPEAFGFQFTNEAGFGGTTRFLKNIVGLWVLQECRRTWKDEGNEYDYKWLNEEAAKASPLRSLINPSSPEFMLPGSMPEKIAAFCKASHQPIPETPGQFTRCILESLALLYRKTIENLETLTGRTIRRLHIVGGGSQSELLNQFSAEATGRECIAGPVEATAIGNILLQSVALGELDSLSSLRAVVRQSFQSTTYKPLETAVWQHAFERFNNL